TSSQLWSTYHKSPSEIIDGKRVMQQDLVSIQALLHQPISLHRHPGAESWGYEISPHGLELGIQYPLANADELIDASTQASREWALASIATRTGSCLETLSRLNERSRSIGPATKRTSGQGSRIALTPGRAPASGRGLQARR